MIKITESNKNDVIASLYIEAANALQHADDNVLEEGIIGKIALGAGAAFVGYVTLSTIISNIKRKNRYNKKKKTLTSLKDYEHDIDDVIREIEKASVIKYKPEVKICLIKITNIWKKYSSVLESIDNQLFSCKTIDEFYNKKDKIEDQYKKLDENLDNEIDAVIKILTESKSDYVENKDIVKPLKEFFDLQWTGSYYTRNLDEDDFWEQIDFLQDAWRNNKTGADLEKALSDAYECMETFPLYSVESYKINKVFQYIQVKFGDSKKVQNESVITESILDPVNVTRCREIFDENDVMKPEVVKFIEDSFNTWVKLLNPDLRIFKVKGFKAIGSSTGFQYTDTSDLDVQVFIEMIDDHEFDDIWELVKLLPNGHNVPGTQHPVNYFFIDENNPTAENKYENLYNLDTGKWEKQTPASKSEIPVLYVREISRLFTDAFDLLIGRYTRDMQYLKDALNLDSTKQDISEKERKETVDKCTTQVRADIDSMRLADKLIHGFRLQAYDDNNFFHISINYMDDDDPRKSMNEAIYKTLDKFEYREKLKKNINEGQVFLDRISPTGDGDSTND